MGRRLGWVAGLLVLGMVVSRTGRLVQFGEGLPLWHLIMIASTLLGAIIWWLLTQAGLRPPAAVGIFAFGAVVVFLRVAVPETLSLGIVPGEETFPLLGERVNDAFRLIRSGVPPVVPNAGLIAILALLMWMLGGLYTQGAVTGKLVVAMVPAGTAYLQFAVFDRQPAGTAWMVASALAVGLAVAAVSLDRTGSVGRARDESGLPIPHASTRAAMAMAVVVGVASIFTTTNAMGLVSEYGNLPWQASGAGFGPGGGNVVFDRFVDLRQRLISRNNTLLFRATLGPGAPPAGQIYWRMETLDEFDGVSWRRANSQTRVYSPGTTIGDSAHTYRGTSSTVLQRVFISRLGGTLLPTAGEPAVLHQIAGSDVIAPQAIRFGRDGALFYTVGIRSDDNYQLESSYPLLEADLGALATGMDGGLSPVFANAAAAGVFAAAPGPPPGDIQRPDDMERYVDLPSILPPQLRATAARQTRGATTDFEKAWLLQHWFRDSGEFTYSQNVSTGHAALVLDDWLNDPTSRNYRTGYCEQFAAAMAVLGRVAGIPSRVVWGFTPGGTVLIDGIEVVEVRDINAHAWVEMWMDGFGWVRFDPTPRGEVLPASITAGWDPVQYVPPPDTSGGVIGPEPEDPDLVDLPPLLGEPVDSPGTGGQGVPRYWLMLVLVAAALAGLVPLAKRLRRRRRLDRARHGDIAAAWDELVDRLTDLGEPVDEHLTPIEFAREQGSALLALARGYSAAIYGDKESQLTDAELIELDWWLQNRFDGMQRLIGSLNPRSLLPKD